LQQSQAPSPGWAVVTGASSGIGAALAERLARHGFHLVLAARDEVALHQRAAKLESAFPVSVRVVPCDLSRPEGIAALEEVMRREVPAVRVLVNNAGFGVHGLFADTDLDAELRLVDLQVRPLLALTKRVLPAMKRDGVGRILNVASVYSFTAVPNQSVYAACKAFLLSFSRGLAAELAGSGVTVTALCPGVTQTQFRTRAGMREKKSFLSLSAEAVADAGFRGMMRGRGVVVPGFWNKVYVGAARLAPGAFFARVARLINSLRGVGKHP
jgi:short-subunit dehydrogenase